MAEIGERPTTGWQWVVAHGGRLFWAAGEQEARVQAGMHDDAELMKRRIIYGELEVVEPTPRTRLWRTQVHVLSVDPALGVFYVEVPGMPAWSCGPFRLRLADLPYMISRAITGDCRMHAHVNIGAEPGDPLIFTRWEMPE